MITLEEAIQSVGGVGPAASVCGVSPRAVYKWLKRKRLPRTEHTGETNYAELMALHAREKQFTADDLLKGMRASAA